MIFAGDAMAGRRVLITGATSGLGLATAALIARCGGRVIAVGRDEARLAAAVGGLHGDGHASRICDVSDADATAALVGEVAAEPGGLHGVFHAAGAGLILPIRMTKSAHLQTVLGAAVGGAFGIARAAGRSGVMAPGSSMVFMSSVAAQRGRQGMAAYAAAKAAIEGAVRALAVELAAKAIRVNALAAGGVHTPMNARAVSSLSEDAADAYVGAHPLGLGEPDDVAGACLFLLSPAAKWITGTVMVVDGGYSAG
jgi:NAD(P)-dependent dehydrogenase (short-subunit alcohol dehydrogenase family)